MVMGYVRQEITPILHGGQRPVGRSLIAVVAEFHCDVGWAAYDSGKQELATRYFTSALHLAHSADDRMLSARVLAAMSHQAIYLGRVRPAIDFAK